MVEFMTYINIVLINFLILFSSDCFSDTIKTNAIGSIDPTKSLISPKIASNFFAARNTYGMRSNAVIAAFQANSERPFDFPILGFTDVSDMANYSDRDSVSLYADNTAPSLKPWEVIKNTRFTKNALISDEIDESKIKTGMIIDTDEKEKWSTYIIKVDNNKVITAGWINSKTKNKGIPRDGTRVFINPTTKIWATNFNIFLPENSLANSAVIQENGLINANIQHPQTLNGIDTVVLPQSKYGGTAAYLARSAVDGYKQKWLVGFMSQGNEVNFRSSDSLVSSPEVGFWEDSNSQNGLVFSGKNQQSSILWKAEDRVLASIDPHGLINKIGYKTQTISDDTDLSDQVGRYIINSNKDIILKLPRKNQVFPGYSIKISKVRTNSNITFITTDKNVMINGNTKETLNEKQWNKEAIFDGTNWFIL